MVRVAGERGVRVDRPRRSAFRPDAVASGTRPWRAQRRRPRAAPPSTCRSGTGTNRPARSSRCARRARRGRPSASVVREPGAQVVLVGGADGEDVGELERRGVVGRRVGVLVVAGGRDEERALRVGVGDRVLEGLRVLVSAPGVVRPRRRSGGVEDGADRVAAVPEPVRAEELERHDRTFQLTPATPGPLLPDGADRPRDVRAVAVVVDRVVVVVHEVPAADVVDVAVAVVVEAVVARTTRPGWSRCWRRDRGGVVDARVDDGDDHRRRRSVVVPGLGRVDVGVGQFPWRLPVWPVLCRPQSWPKRGSSGSVSRRGSGRSARRSARAVSDEAPPGLGPCGPRPARRRRRRESGEGVRRRSHPQPRRRAARPRSHPD